MSKLLLIFIVLVALDLCLARRGYRQGRPNRRQRQRQRAGYSFDDDFFGRGGHGRHHQWDRFGGGRYSFGLGPRHDPWFNMGFSWERDNRPWWTGPNVCFSRTNDTEIADENEPAITRHMSYQTQVCDGHVTVRKCTTAYMTPAGKETVTETYECCLGFTRTHGAYGCDQAFDVHDIVETIEKLELNEMANALDGVGLNEDFFNEAGSNFTVFAPLDEAFQNYLGYAPDVAPGITLQDMSSVMVVSEPIKEKLLNNTRSLLLGHVAVGSYPSHYVQDNQLIETASPFKSKIRINTYQTPISLFTANCRKITKVDNLATNGVVHVIDSMLTPVGDTLSNLISKNPELSVLKTAIGASSLGAALRDDGSFTLLAPTNTAFSKLDQSLLKKILSDSDCLDNVLKNHIFPDVICSEIIQGDVKTMNLLKKYTNLTRDANDKLYAHGTQIVTADIMGTNGVLHIIDDVLLTDEALSVLDLAEKQGANMFVDLVERAGLQKELTALENVTVFVPCNEAIMALDPKLVADAEKLQEVLKFHVVQDTRTCSNLFNNLELDTVSGEKLRINEYSSFPFGHYWTQTAQCANIRKSDIKGCKSVIHVIDKVMVPPIGNVIDVIGADSRFSTLVKLIKEANLGDELQKQGPYTVFAPTDDVFDQLSEDTITALRDDRDVLKSTLQNHITRDFVCCAGIINTGWFNTQKVRTLSGEVYNLGRDSNDELFVGQSTVQQCDMTATNGVVHAVDAVLMSHRQPFRRPYSWQFDWDWH